MQAKLPIDGVLLLDKPAGLSSAAAVARVRRLYQAAKGGHTGTLDPLASGLLPICLGEATKFASDLLDAAKGYRTTLVLGTTTTTGDAEGGILEERPVNVDRAALEAALAPLRGPILQVPPMYSALKRDGRPLYSYARAGEEVERAARAVTIMELELVEFRPPLVTLDVLCSKGTYVRVLGEDIGRLLGCGAHLGSLRRTRVGRFSIGDSLELAALEQLEGALRSARLLPCDALVSELPQIELDDPHAARFVMGQRLAGCKVPPPGRVRVYAAQGRRFLGVGTVEDDAVLAPKRLVATVV